MSYILCYICANTFRRSMLDPKIKALHSEYKTLRYRRGIKVDLHRMKNNTLACDSHKDNNIYIRGEFTRKKCKTAILLYCIHIAVVLHIFVLYNLYITGISFYRKSKINIKRKPNYEIGWFHN